MGTTMATPISCRQRIKFRRFGNREGSQQIRLEAAQILARLVHYDKIVRLYDFGELSGNYT